MQKVVQSFWRFVTRTPLSPRDDLNRVMKALWALWPFGSEAAIVWWPRAEVQNLNLDLQTSYLKPEDSFYSINNVKAKHCFRERNVQSLTANFCFWCSELHFPTPIFYSIFTLSYFLNITSSLLKKIHKQKTKN